MTRSQLVASLQHLHAATAAWEREDAYQRQLQQTYKNTRVRSPLNLGAWLKFSAVVLVVGFLAGFLHIAGAIIVVAVLWRVAVAVNDRMKSRPASKRYQAAAAHNGEVSAAIAQSKRRQGSFAGTYQSLGGTGFYPASRLSTRDIARVIAVVQDHRADSVGQAINLLAHADAQSRRDAQTAAHQDAMQAELRRARADANTNAMLTRWTINDQRRR
ncbi:hypothetical protein [Gordonia sp. 852002-51296_SCH5728562-b]|uniref:hypothetical protein n=1 Tax=Gordonia sp. 852002-51296_SCH5728562-b TaxID=1834101 RepID=UPI0007EB7CFE|nr:hypothetical protein [Gordonia sp. 852002-51296_SCH5728562-b]OBA38998.1 hypothetical protein A5766_04390 [Gordonia sp. 852002-51296_SCH5728562-b]